MFLPIFLPPQRAAMALSKLSADEHGIILSQLCNALEPRLIVYFSSASSGLRALLTPALLQRLKADHEVAAALCRKMGMSCKEPREAKKVSDKGLSVADLATLGSLGSVLPALEDLFLGCYEEGPYLQRLVEGLVAGALPAVTALVLRGCRYRATDSVWYRVGPTGSNGGQTRASRPRDLRCRDLLGRGCTATRVGRSRAGCGGAPAAWPSASRQCRGAAARESSSPVRPPARSRPG